MKRALIFGLFPFILEYPGIGIAIDKVASAAEAYFRGKVKSRRSESHLKQLRRVEDRELTNIAAPFHGAL
jgi:hypothetical protein